MMKSTCSLVVALLGLSLNVTGHESQPADIHIMQPWSRELPAVAKNGAAYAVLRNHGKTADRLLGGSSPMAERIELHTHVMDGGIARMRRVESVELAPDTPVILEPGGLHLMLFGLKEPLVEGKRYSLSLEFARMGNVEVEVLVRASDAVGTGYPSHEHHGGHGTKGEHGAMHSAMAAGQIAKTFEFVIGGGKLGDGEQTIRVIEGDWVELQWSSDEALTLHMHGYNIELDVTPDSPAIMRFHATRTGRFSILNHDGSPPNVLLFLEVQTN